MHNKYNDDDYYIVHPTKKHIAFRISSKNSGVSYGQKPEDSPNIRSAISMADKKHGEGHIVKKGRDLHYDKNTYNQVSESTMDKFLEQAPFSASPDQLAGFAPKRPEPTIIKEDKDEDDTPRSKGNAFDWKGMIAKRKEDSLRNHEKEKTATGTVYKRKEDAKADETDTKPQEKRGRGRPPGVYGSYKKRIKEALESHSLSTGRLDELSKSTLASYANKSAKSAADLATTAIHLKNTSDDWYKYASDKKKEGDKPGERAAIDSGKNFGKYSSQATEKQIKRLKGVNTAVSKLAKEDVDQIDESVSHIVGKIASRYNIPHKDAHAIFVGGSTSTMSKSQDHLCDKHGYNDGATSYKENEGFFKKAGVSKEDHDKLAKAGM